MTAHFRHIHEGINRGLAPLEPHQELHGCVTRTAETVYSTSANLEELRGQIADIGGKAVELVGVTFPEAAVETNRATTRVIDRSLDELHRTLQGTHDGRALEGLKCIGDAREASIALNENLMVGGQELAQQIQVKLDELLGLMDVVAAQGLRTTVLDRWSLVRMADNEVAPPFQAVAEPIMDGISLIRQFQQSIG